MTFIISNVIGGAGGRSIDFERGSSQFLSMSDANFGAFDRAKFAISVWVKRESVSTTQGIFAQYSVSAGNRAFFLSFNGSNQLTFRTNADGTALDGFLATTATYASTSSWYHIMVHFDSANATAGDRMRLWVNGSEVTSFGTDTNPTAAVVDSSADMIVGAENSASGYFDGLIHQAAFFSGSLPAIGDVYDSGPIEDISGVTGLYSLLDADGSPINDAVLASDWTNNNGAVSSAVVPT